MSSFRHELTLNTLSRITFVALSTDLTVGSAVPADLGVLYMTKHMASGKLKRRPTKVLPYVTPHQAIQHWLLRPGKYDELQQWRREGDEPGQVPATRAGADNAFAVE